MEGFRTLEQCPVLVLSALDLVVAGGSEGDVPRYGDGTFGI
jgi:hypothetical protein